MNLSFFRRYRFSSLLVLCIVIISLIPIPEVKPLIEIPFYDKWTHLLMYGVLSLCVGVEFFRFNPHRSALPFLLGSLFFPMILGGLLELAQAYLTICRSGEWADFLANSTGAFIGMLLALLWGKSGLRSKARS